MRKILFFTFGFLLLLTAVILIGVPVVVNSSRPRLETEIQKALKEKCASCLLSFEDMHWYWMNGLVFEDIHFTGGPKGGQEVDAKIASVAIWPNFRELLHKELRLNLIYVENPVITFTDGEKVSPKGRHFEDPDENLIRAYAVEQLHLKGGKFTYIRNLKGTHAVFVVHKIEMTTQAFGSTADLKPEPAQAHLSAQIGDQGKVTLDISSPLFAKPLQIDTALHVTDQSLEELSKFFKPNAGVELKGTLVKGSAETHLRDRHLKASVLAKYDNFSLKVDPMYDRSEVVAFFTNLGASIGLREKNVENASSDQAKTIETDREAGESIVSFMLRGIKEASIDIARGDTAARHHQTK